MPRASDQSDSHMSESFLTDHSSVTHCPACGHENPPAHKFCGACGGALEDERAASPVAIRDLDFRERNSQEREANPPREVSSKSYETGQAFEDSITNPHELSLFRSFRPAGSDDDEDYEEESGFRRYRVYVGAILAVILSVLGYMAWRSSQAASQRAHEAPLPPPVTAQQTPAPAVNTAPRTIPPEQKVTASNEQNTQKAAKKASASSSSERSTAPVAPSGDSPAALEGRGSADNGDEELAMAQHFLNGTSSQGRDSAEAAKWLWKSIAKHNSAATVLLADLYLKGDGVSKNCDQARVLLDSAARKGFPPAGERLRNLQAFGCQ